MFLVCGFQAEDARQSDSVGAHACLLYEFVMSVGCGKICWGWHQVSVKNPLMETEKIFADRTRMAECRNQAEKKEMGEEESK